MTQKTTAFIVLILLLGFGFLVGTFFSGFFGQLTVPSGHKAIADKLTVKDTSLNVALTVQYVESGSKQYGVPLSTSFVLGKKYVQSTWVWTRNGDVELAMTIWGPDDSGKKYSVEFGRVGLWGGGEIWFQGAVKFNVPAVTDSSSGKAEGYYWFEVKVT